MAHISETAWNSLLSRRSLLKAGVLSTLGLDLAGLLRLRHIQASEQGAGQPARADACILIWLAGGPSHIDTLDPKPDAGVDVRGEFKPIETACPGIQVSEVLPRIAASMNRLTLIRGMTSPEADHDRASHHLMTGYRPSPALVYPSHGSVVNAVRESSRAGSLPTYVSMPDLPAFGGAGYLTPARNPFSTNADPNNPRFRVRDLTPPDRLNLARLQRRRGMVAALDQFAHDVPPSTLTTSRDQFTERAFDLLTSATAQEAFAIDREPTETRDAYGRTTLGQSCLLARRLVERGVGFVTIDDRGTGQLGWDTHQQNFPSLKDRLAPPLDQGLSALVADLESRGLLERTLVLVMGEFGRTPKINPTAGRDHHGRANSIILAGGGVRGGQVLGRTDRQGDSPEDRPVTPSDLAATVFTLLGINPETKLLSQDQQPIRLVDQGRCVTEIL